MADPRRILLVSYPRSASNLLVKMLALDDQPNVTQDVKRGYHFMKVVDIPVESGLWANPLSQWGEDKDRVRKAAQEGFEALEETRAAGDAQRKITFVKEHALLLLDPHVVDHYIFGENMLESPDYPWRLDGGADADHDKDSSVPNDTFLSKTYLRQWQLVFLIRHPAQAFASMYRIFAEGQFKKRDISEQAIQNFFTVSMTLRFSRRLYELAKELHPDTEPLMLDADDIIKTPAVVQKFADKLGMDPSKVTWTWEPVPKEVKEKMTPRGQRMLSTLQASNGVMADKVAGEVDIDAEAAKWREEFGEDGAKKLEAWVRAAMPDYLYLKEKCLVV